MIRNKNQVGHIYNFFDSNPKVYVVSIFEIEEGHELPQTKKELIKLMENETVIPFHLVGSITLAFLGFLYPGCKDLISSSVKAKGLSPGSCPLGIF